MGSIEPKDNSPVFTVCHKVISLTSLCLVYSLLQYIFGDVILSNWTGPCDA